MITDTGIRKQKRHSSKHLGKKTPLLLSQAPPQALLFHTWCPLHSFPPVTSSPSLLLCATGHTQSLWWGDRWPWRWGQCILAPLCCCFLLSLFLCSSMWSSPSGAVHALPWRTSYSDLSVPPAVPSSVSSSSHPSPSFPVSLPVFSSLLKYVSPRCHRLGCEAQLCPAVGWLEPAGTRCVQHRTVPVSSHKGHPEVPTNSPWHPQI